MKKLLVAVVALLVIVGVVLAVRTIGARDETDAVDRDEASQLVQKDKGGDDATATDDGSASSIDRGLRPAAGTYTYRGTGRESVSALGGSEHVFPAEIPVVVELDPADDCAWTSNVIYVKQHVEERRFCTTRSGTVDRGFVRKIEFFNQTQVADYSCGADAQRYRADAPAGSTRTWECTEGTKSTSRYTATSLGPVTLRIGGAPVETSHVRVVSKQTGDTRGTDSSEFWYDENGLAVRFHGKLDVRAKSVLGDTRFQEQYTYELTSVTPKADGDADSGGSGGD